MGTQIPSFQNFGASSFHKDLEERFEEFLLNVFEKRMRIHMISHVKLRSSTSYHMFLTHFGQLLMELYALKLPIGLQ